GLVRVVNLAFEKMIIIRYTTDEWKGFRDIWADYVSSTPDKRTDKYTFRISLCASMFNEKKRLQFAICFRAKGEEYWDNNNERNY
ncbi:predicted protein, partial [Nematostella vectensis]